MTVVLALRYVSLFLGVMCLLRASDLMGHGITREGLFFWFAGGCLMGFVGDLRKTLGPPEERDRR